MGMTVGDLLDQLRDQPRERKVILARDGEGTAPLGARERAAIGRVASALLEVQP